VTPAAGDRLAKYLAHCGVAARRRAEQAYIATGRVTVNGLVVTDPATRVSGRDQVAVDGRAIRPEATATYAVHKPAGTVSAASDGRGRPTVVDLIQGTGLRLYPVGRLDTDSEGLILVTNDGELTQALLHPRRGVPREYAALVRPRPDPGMLVRLESGVALSDGPARAADVRVLTRGPEAVGPGAAGTWMSLTLREGRNREARRMLAAVGLDALRLVRVRFGGLRLGRLAPGQFRRLSPEEIGALRLDAGRGRG